MSITAPTPRIETPRLLLRPPVRDDFDRYAEMMGDPEAARYIGGVKPRAAAWRGFLQMPGAWAVQGFAMFSVIDRADGRWLGQVGPWQPEGWPGTEVGWSLHRDAWGHGYAAEAAVAAIGWAFEHLGWQEVIHCIDPDNHRSERLAQRLGSRLRGPGRLPAPFEELTVRVWGQSRAEWEGQPRAWGGVASGRAPGAHGTKAQRSIVRDLVDGSAPSKPAVSSTHERRRSIESARDHRGSPRNPGGAPPARAH